MPVMKVEQNSKQSTIKDIVSLMVVKARSRSLCIDVVTSVGEYQPFIKTFRTSYDDIESIR